MCTSCLAHMCLLLSSCAAPLSSEIANHSDIAEPEMGHTMMLAKPSDGVGSRSDLFIRSTTVAAFLPCGNARAHFSAIVQLDEQQSRDQNSEIVLAPGQSC